MQTNPESRAYLFLIFFRWFRDLYFFYVLTPKSLLFCYTIFSFPLLRPDVMLGTDADITCRPNFARKI